MAATNIQLKVEDAARFTDEFASNKNNKQGSKYKFAIFTIQLAKMKDPEDSDEEVEKEQVCIERFGTPDEEAKGEPGDPEYEAACFEKLRTVITSEFSDKPAFVVYQINGTDKEGVRKLDKLVHIGWNPDDGGIRQKMKYAGTEGHIKGTLGQVLKISDISDLTLAAVQTEVDFKVTA